jgi:hypothetical protein
MTAFGLCHLAQAWQVTRQDIRLGSSARKPPLMKPHAHQGRGRNCARFNMGWSPASTVIWGSKA